jgi:hypothetical protein
MGSRERVEACGRCSMSTVIETAGDEEGSGRDPFAGDRIELSEDELRTASPHVVALARAKRRLNEWATRLTYGR